MAKRIIKNLSGETKQILKRTVVNGDQFDIPPHLWLELIDNTGIFELVTSGDYVVNDGDIDLSPDAAILHLQLSVDAVHEPVEFSAIFGDNTPEVAALNEATYGLKFDIGDEIRMVTHLDNPLPTEDISLQLHLGIDNTVADRWVQFEITFLTTTGIGDKTLNTHDAVINTSQIEVPTTPYLIFDIVTLLPVEYFENGEDNIFFKIRRIDPIGKTSPENRPALVRVDKIYRRKRNI